MLVLYYTEKDLMKSCEVNMSIEIVFIATIKHSPKIDKFKRFGKFFRT